MVNLNFYLDKENNLYINKTEGYPIYFTSFENWKLNTNLIDFFNIEYCFNCVGYYDKSYKFDEINLNEFTKINFKFLKDELFKNIENLKQDINKINYKTLRYWVDYNFNYNKDKTIQLTVKIINPPTKTGYKQPETYYDAIFKLDHWSKKDNLDYFINKLARQEGQEELIEFKLI